MSTMETNAKLGFSFKSTVLEDRMIDDLSVSWGLPGSVGADG